MKVCSGCGVEKPDSEYAWANKQLGYKNPKCKTCRRTANQIWYQANREQQNDKSKQAYYTNRETRLAQCREWNKAHKEQRAANMREWRKVNPDKVRASNHKQRVARRSGCTAEDIEYVKMTQTFGGELKCFYCASNITNNQYHLDHIIPLSRGGKNLVDNVCISCPICNMSKGSKLLLVEWWG